MHSCFPALLNVLLVVLPGRRCGTTQSETKQLCNVDFQSSANTPEAPATQVQQLTSRIFKHEKLFADQIATHTSITAGIHSQYFFLFDKFHHLEAGSSDAII